MRAEAAHPGLPRPEKVFAGRVHLCLQDMALGSIGRSIYCRGHSDGPWRKILTLPADFPRRLAAGTVYGQRLFRAEIHHMVQLPDGVFAVFFHKKVYFISLDGTVHHVEPLKGGRPLCVIAHGDGVIYGEYISNPERRPIGLFHVSPSGTRTLLEMTGIRHIHGVFRRKEELFLTTGDLDEESMICRVDLDTGALPVLAKGSQQYRAVALEFADEAVYFATDAPNDPNHFYKLRNGEKTRLASIEGPVFYMTRVGGALYFGTVVEPSIVNTDRTVYLYRHDLITQTTCKIFQAPKDRLPMKLFQYGQIKFPGMNLTNELLFTPYAVAGWQGTYRIPADSAGLPEPMAEQVSEHD